MGGYTLARFFIERLRIDTANKILGLRVNEWVSALIFLAAAGFLAVDAWRHRGEPPVATATASEPAAGDGRVTDDISSPDPASSS